MKIIITHDQNARGPQKVEATLVFESSVSCSWLSEIEELRNRLDAIESGHREFVGTHMVGTGHSLGLGWLCQSVEIIAKIS